MKTKMTAKQKRDAEWIFLATMRNCGSNHVWTIQQDTITKEKRYCRATDSRYGDASSGKCIIRYLKPRN